MNDFKHRIDIYGNKRVTNTLGEESYKYEKIKSIWAAVVPQTGALQRQQADTILTNVTHKIIVRHNAGKDIVKENNIHFRGHKFEIRYILNPYFDNETIEIFVQEVLR